MVFLCCANCFTLNSWENQTSLMAQMVKRLPTMWEIWVQYLGWEDLLEKEMATHSSILAWKIPWMEEPGRLQSMGSQRVRHDWVTLLTHSMRESIARYVDKKSGVPEEERKVWGSQEGHRVWSSQGGEKDRLFFFFFFRSRAEDCSTEQLILLKDMFFLKLCQVERVKLLSVVQLFAIPWTVVY